MWVMEVTGVETGKQKPGYKCLIIQQGACAHEQHVQNVHSTLRLTDKPPANTHSAGQMFPVDKLTCASLGLPFDSITGINSLGHLYLKKKLLINQAIFAMSMVPVHTKKMLLCEQGREMIYLS